jgi:hypothetical protein
MRHITRLAELDARGEATEKDLRDARGQFFTPMSVATPLVTHSLEALGPRETLRIIDPCSGDGRLCAEVVRQVSMTTNARLVEVDLWEIHPEMVDLARSSDRPKRRPVTYRE